MSLIKLSKTIYSKKVCVKKYQKERWKREFACPKCGGIKCWKHGKLKNGLQKYRCRYCKHVFSDQSNTVFHNSKIPPEKSLIIWYQSHFKSTCRDTAIKSETNKNTVHRLNKKIMNLKSKLVTSTKQLKGFVEVDETKMSGKWHVGLQQRKGDYVVVEVPNRTEFTLSNLIWKYVEEGSVIMTDSWGGYQPHPEYFSHYTVNHSKYFVHPKCNKIHTNTIEGLWMHLKREINHFRLGVRLNNIPTYINQLKYNKKHKKLLNINFFPLLCTQLN